MPRLPKGDDTRKDPDAKGKYGGLVKMIMDNINDTNLWHWLYGVAATGVVHRNKYVNFPSGPSGIPNGWT